MLFAACSYTAPGVEAPIDTAPPEAGETDGLVTLDATVDAAPTCPADYMPLNGSLYRFVPDLSAWIAAELDCEDDGFGTHLVVDPTNGDMDAISSASNTWVGLSNLSTAWRWVDGTSGPSLDSNVNRCGRYFDATGGGPKGMQESDCANTLPYVCECDLVEPDPDAF